MNAIVIIADTLRRDHLGCYGNDWIRTPNLDRFARESLVFDRAYTASFPTVPNRADVMTGKFTLTYRGWEPLGRGETVLPRVLAEVGIRSMMIADTPHILADGYNFQRGFNAWEWIRGQETDKWKTDPTLVTFPCHLEKLRNDVSMTQYLRNIAEWRGEDDCFCARTMTAACEWLDRNHENPFFLYVDTFDPHEPWDPPQHYVDLYDPGYEGERVTYPRYAPPDFLSEAELRHARALYAGEVSLVDTWIGRVLEKVDALGLADDTYVFITTDHGFCHGEHDLIGKSYIDDVTSSFGYCPLWEEIARIPLLVRGPGVTPGRAPFFVQPPDLMPTLVDLLHVDQPKTIQGRSYADILHGGKTSIRDFALSGPSLTGRASGGKLTFTMGEWSLVHRAEPGDGAVERAVDSLPRSPKVLSDTSTALYHLTADPGQAENVLEEHRPVAEAMHKKMLAFLAEMGAPEAELEARKEL